MGLIRMEDDGNIWTHFQISRRFEHFTARRVQFLACACQTVCIRISSGLYGSLWPFCMLIPLANWDVGLQVPSASFGHNWKKRAGSIWLLLGIEFQRKVVQKGNDRKYMSVLVFPRMVRSKYLYIDDCRCIYMQIFQDLSLWFNLYRYVQQQIRNVPRGVTPPVQGPYLIWYVIINICIWKYILTICWFRIVGFVALIGLVILSTMENSPKKIIPKLLPTVCWDLRL